MREGIDDKAFPEQGAKVSIHSDGSFEGLGCVLANTNLNVLTAVFYWFTLKRDEPFYGDERLVAGIQLREALHQVVDGFHLRQERLQLVQRQRGRAVALGVFRIRVRF